MIALLLIIMILGSAIPSYKNAVSTIAWGRLSSITIIFSALLILNTLYVSRLETGLSLFSGFFKVNLINQSIEIIMLIIAGLILIPLINIIYPLASASCSASRSKVNNKLYINYEIALPKVSGWMNNYFLIIVFNLIGACCLMTSNDLLTLYISIELQSFSLYILATLNKDSINSASAGLKYFLIGSLASAFILIGIAIFYLLTGLTNFESLYIFFNITDYFTSSMLMEFFNDYFLWNFDVNNLQSSLIILASIFILVGTFIKIGAAPFHQWTPDVYDQVPTKVTIWLVIIPKISIFILLLNILDIIIGTGNASNFSPLASLVIDGVNGWSGFINYDYYTGIDYIMNLFLWKILDNFDHANFFNINYDFVGWMNYYRTEISFNYHFLTNHPYYPSYYALKDIMPNYSTDYHNTIFLNYFIPTLQEVLIKNVLIIISVISMIIGAIAGLYQIKIKRLLAYSAVNHVGFLILALAINTKTGLESFLFYLTQYSITNLNLFLIIIAFGYLSYNSYLNKNYTNISDVSNSVITGSATGIYNEKGEIIDLLSSSSAIKGEQDINFISQLTGLFKNNSLLAMSFAITLFSFAGVPPLLGFYGKMQVLYTAISVGFIFVSIIAINMSVISAYYYLKLIQVSNFISSNISSYGASPTIEKISINKTSNYNSVSSITLQKITSSKNIIKNSHSYLISLITLIILLFSLKTELLLNFTTLITSYSYYV